MDSHRVQMVMGTVFTGMGVATMLFPVSVANLSFHKEFLGKGENDEETVTPALKLVIQCFGSQASLCGLLILTSKFNARTFRYFGLAMIPYVAFDIALWKNRTLTTMGALGDGIGNLIFMSCCYAGYSMMKSCE